VGHAARHSPFPGQDAGGGTGGLAQLVDDRFLPGQVGERPALYH
jgi:hypothetical protein